MSDRNTYTDRLLSYWDRKFFGWKHKSYTHQASEVNPLCGDEVEYRLVIVNGVLEAVDAWARGCCVCECCTAMLTELARGKTVEWLHGYTEEVWDKYVNIPLGESRKRSCQALPLNTLKKAANAKH